MTNGFLGTIGFIKSQEMIKGTVDNNWAPVAYKELKWIKFTPINSAIPQISNIKMSSDIGYEITLQGLTNNTNIICGNSINGLTNLNYSSQISCKFGTDKKDTSLTKQDQNTFKFDSLTGKYFLNGYNKISMNLSTFLHNKILSY